MAGRGSITADVRAGALLSASHDTVLPDPTHRALDRAAERVLRKYQRDPGAAADSALSRDLSEVVEGVRAALAGDPCEFRAVGLFDRVRLLGALRTELVRSWSQDDTALLTVMQAFEVTSEALVVSARGSSFADALEPTSRSALREVAHLLRSPLGSIVMMSDTLRDERSGPLNDTQKYQVDIIYRAALGVAGTAGDLLTHFGEDPLARIGPMSVAEVMATAADMLRPVVDARHCQLVVRPTADGLRSGSATALTRVLLSLGLRAAVMARDGSVELEARPDGSDVHFSVRVRGIQERVIGDGADMLRVLRLDADTAGPVLSVSALALSAAGMILDQLGSEIEIETPSEGELRLAFSLSLPPTT